MTRHVPRQARAPISERPAEPLPVQCLAVPGGDAMRFSVGIDWASAAHAVCILDQTGRVHWQGAVPHTADGLADLLARLRRFRRRGSLRVALERPSGLLVDTLLDAGLEVVRIHPIALKASRPRYSAAGAKSDPGDAFILADLLRTDGHRFRPLHPPSDDTRALRALVRGRDDLVAQRIALANQLRALLERFWPGAAAIFADVDSPIALAFLARYPTPDSAARLGEQRLAQFLGQHAYCGRRPVVELLARLRTAPASQVGEAEAEASGDLVRALVAVLSPLAAHLRHLSAAIAAALAQHPDGPLVQSLPRSGAVNAAQILAELGDDRARFPTDEQFAAEAGLAPVTHASGQHRAVVFRWACNKRLRRAVTTFADNSRHASRWAALVYQRARARGCRHQHAIRIRARARAHEGGARHAKRGDGDQPHHGGAHAAHQRRHVGRQPARDVERREQDEDDAAGDDHRRETAEGAGHAGQAVTERDREVRERRPGQELREREVLEELVDAHPAPARHERLVEERSAAAADGEDAGQREGAHDLRDGHGRGHALTRESEGAPSPARGRW